jgi:hypothetical protein
MPDLNLGVVGNSSVAALIDRRGRIVWYIVCAMRLSKSWEEAFWRGW